MLLNDFIVSALEYVLLFFSQLGVILTIAFADSQFLADQLFPLNCLLGLCFICHSLGIGHGKVCRFYGAKVASLHDDGQVGPLLPDVVLATWGRLLVLLSF